MAATIPPKQTMEIVIDLKMMPMKAATTAAPVR
jgi:hypothetical protein